MKKGPLFLNTPITSPEQDIVGVGIYVDTLDQAIEKGAQMIGIAAPSGAGKSSVAQLLRRRREQAHRDGGPQGAYAGERFITVSMGRCPGGEPEPGRRPGDRPGGHADPEETAETVSEMHKTLVRQLAVQIAPKKAGWILQQLDKEPRPQARSRKRAPWLPAAALVLVLALWLALRGGMERFRELIPWMVGSTGVLLAAALVLGVCLAALLLNQISRALSSRKGARKGAAKSGKKRKELADGTVDLYRSELLVPRSVLWPWWRRLRRGVHYIAVVEDLDRTDDPVVVLRFLSELYKYGVAEKETPQYFNRVTFLVNIGPESAMVPQGLLRGNDSLYTRIFDYVLNLHAINTDNYDAVLNGLLEEHRDELRQIGIQTESAGKLSDLPGMQWIIREHRLGIREIKERLNLAFERYEALQERFPGARVSFERCAAAAYLSSAFEEDVLHTDDRAYQKLVDHCRQNPEEETYSEGVEACRSTLPDTSVPYQKAVWELIQARLIDESYRVYFYNCPKDSRLYTAQESAVMNAILYGEDVPGLDEMVAGITAQGSTAIEEAYQKLQQLGLPLPRFVLENEILYVTAVRSCFDSVLRKLAGLDRSPEAEQKTLEVYRRILSYDGEREIYGEGQARQLCALWQRELSEPSLLSLRKMLCQSYGWEIRWYRSLFFQPHRIITPEELDCLPLSVDLGLIDLRGEKFSRKEVDYVVRRFTSLSPQDREKIAGAAERFLHDALAVLGIEVMALPLLHFMAAAGRLSPGFEGTVASYITSLKAGEEKETLFAAYQRQINQAAAWGLSGDTAQRVSGMDRYEGYTPETAQCLRDAGFSTDYVLMSLLQGRDIPYEDEDILDGLETNGQWLLDNHRELFLSVRLDIAGSRPKLLEQYAFLFGEGFPIVTAQELEALWELAGDIDKQVLALLPPERVTPDAAGYLAGFFSRRKQTAGVTLELLHRAARMEKGCAWRFFYGLDFDAVCYRSLSEAKRNAVRAELAPLLELEKTENQLKFMRATMCLDPGWEQAMAPELKQNDGLKRLYADTVNHCEKMTKNTAEIVMGLGTIFGMAPQLTDKVFQAKQYSWYVTSKIQWDKQFIMEEGERGDALWPTYMDIFGKKSHKNWDRIKGYMRENEKFLRRIMDTEAYREFTDDNRLSLTGILQDAASIRECLERGSQFALRYYRQIKGFADEDAANAFMDVVCRTPVLLASNDLYEHTRGLLPNANLKTRYTNQRRKK